jgi:hypothetical protein
MRVLISARYTWFCGRRTCGAQHTEQVLLDPGAIVPHPKTPPGWNLINGRLYCSKHTISVAVDGKLTTDCTGMEHSDKPF